METITDHDFTPHADDPFYCDTCGEPDHDHADYDPTPEFYPYDQLLAMKIDRENRF